MFYNGNQNQQRIGREEEDDPEYRSVMIRPRMSLTPLPSMNRKLIRTEGASNKQNLVVAKSSPLSPIACSFSSSPHRWTVQELTELPTDYMLVRTNVYVKDSNPQLVADGICNTLKSLSITIDNNINKSFEGGENALLAETQYGAKFAIRLFSHNSMVVVEIQRTSGCSFEFRDAAKVILRSARTGLHHHQHQKQKRIVRPERRFTIPLTLPKRSRDERQKCIKDDFKIAYNMLRSNKSDMQVLALESMEQMTKKSCNVKDIAAKSILGNCDHLKQLLLLLYTCDTTNTTTDPTSQSSYLLRRKVLTVLANSFEAISTIELATILSTNDNDLIKTRSFLSSLLSCLHNSSILPHDAYQAVRCLRYLLISKEVETAMIEMSAIGAISYACSNGCNYHEGLEQESNKLMIQLQQKFVC